MWQWVALAFLAGWIVAQHRTIRALTDSVTTHSEILQRLTSLRHEVIAEEIPSAREALGDAVERLDVSRVRERVDPEERREV